jgi:predicted acylesterase/phospholipase RssA
MRALAYVGAVQAFESAGIEAVSVSACSAGTIVGALVTAGMPGGEIERLVLRTDFRRFASQDAGPALPPCDDGHSRLTARPGSRTW